MMLRNRSLQQWPWKQMKNLTNFGFSFPVKTFPLLSLSLLSYRYAAHSRHPSGCGPHVHGLRWNFRSLRQSPAPAWQEEEVWHQSPQENAEPCLQWDICIQGGSSLCVIALVCLALIWISAAVNRKTSNINGWGRESLHLHELHK